jgi:hypothetical protein
MCSRHPLQSLVDRRLYGLRRRLPCGSPRNGLGTLPSIARRCSPCDACGVAAALALTASSLALFSARLPGRNGPSRSSAKHRYRPRIAAGPVIDPSFGSTSERSSAAPPGSHRDPLMGLDQGNRLAPAPLPFAPPSTLPGGRPLASSPLRVHSRTGSKLPIFGPGMPIPESRSALVVSHHLDGFLRAAARGLVASLCRPWGS